MRIKLVFFIVVLSSITFGDVFISAGVGGGYLALPQKIESKQTVVSLKGVNTVTSGASFQIGNETMNGFGFDVNFNYGVTLCKNSRTSRYETAKVAAQPYSYIPHDSSYEAGDMRTDIDIAYYRVGIRLRYAMSLSEKSAITFAFGPAIGYTEISATENGDNIYRYYLQQNGNEVYREPLHSYFGADYSLTLDGFAINGAVSYKRQLSQNFYFEGGIDLSVSKISSGTISGNFGGNTFYYDYYEPAEFVAKETSWCIHNQLFLILGMTVGK